MKQNIIHIGLDVDDTQYHGSAFNKTTGEVVDFKSRPTLKGRNSIQITLDETPLLLADADH